MFSDRFIAGVRVLSLRQQKVVQQSIKRSTYQSRTTAFLYILELSAPKHHTGLLGTRLIIDKKM